ncbi:heterokaryon incompatibility protein-domain-containing protein [Suillus placidus]|uniref:Heterokaryon incompatibility protein-domain-containing protein n=2 Tax=Suillus placidus TaxID=48579 RepID=A0A9P6ZQ11_9AGAM|nr:heterokaryon incompatibility protein-domain-containing protein [Suillus placidus]
MHLLTQDIHTHASDYTLYAHRSFVLARKLDWDHALEDAIKSISIQPSLTGFISKGIALCGQGHVREARAVFDVASISTDQNLKTNHFLLLTKAIALFSADKHDEAILLVKELAAVCPTLDPLGCHVVETYIRVQLGINAFDSAHHDEATDHFTVAVNSGAFSSKYIHQIYEDLTVLFGWDLESLCLTAHQKRCQAFLSAGKPDEALEAHQYMMHAIDESAKASCLDWSNGKSFKQECSAFCVAKGDVALTASDYDKAIDLYSAAINSNFASDAVFAKCSKAKLGKMLWIEALLDVQKVIELDSLSYLGYNLKYEALHGAQRYDEAIQTFQTMLSKLDNAPDIQTRKLRQQYRKPSEVERDIQQVIDAQLDNAPLRVLNTTTGLLYNREAQKRAFKMSIEYKELVSSTIMHPGLHMKRIEEVAMTYLRYAMLSHRWDEKEPELQDIQGKGVYDSELDMVSGMSKLRSFCKTARDAGCNWAWSDTCCIDKNASVEFQESVTSMFRWYHHSALTIVYLSDVSSKSGTLATSDWTTRGWTVQEFIAPKVILFYQNNWTLYLGDDTLNHKKSSAIMQELKVATGIDLPAFPAFRPSMSGAREKLRWASTRITTRQEDIAYSLFGIFDVRLFVDYGEKQDKAFGRLLQEIVARSGDITSLDWVGKPSDFNSCLPASITAYQAPPCKLPLLLDDQILSSVSSLRKTEAVDFASNLYTKLRDMRAPRFATQRLHLPCLAFNVTEVRVRRLRSLAPEAHFTYGVKADGLHDLDITTEETLVQFWPVRPTEQKFVLVRPWDRSLLELPDFSEPLKFMELSDFGHDTESEEEYGTPPSSPSDDRSSDYPVKQEVVDLESRALRLLVRLGQPFSAFLLAQQHSGEYKRIASDHDIIGQVKDALSVGDIRTIEIL